MLAAKESGLLREAGYNEIFDGESQRRRKKNRTLESNYQQVDKESKLEVNIGSITTMREATTRPCSVSRFLSLCGSIRAELPRTKIHESDL